MPDPFVPEADAFEQQQEADFSSEADDEDGAEWSRGERDQVPMEAPEADVLEQNQLVGVDDQFEDRDDVRDDRSP